MAPCICHRPVTPVCYRLCISLGDDRWCSGQDCAGGPVYGHPPVSRELERRSLRLAGTHRTGVSFGCRQRTRSSACDDPIRSAYTALPTPLGRTAGAAPAGCGPGTTTTVSRAAGSPPGPVGISSACAAPQRDLEPVALSLQDFLTSLLPLGLNGLPDLSVRLPMACQGGSAFWRRVALESISRAVLTPSSLTAVNLK